MKQNSFIEIQNLTKVIGNKTIVDNLSLNIFSGEVFGLLGPNGAGKTTTIRMLVGLISVTSGEILIGGKSILSNFEEAIRNVGAIVENPEFYNYLSGYKNLLYYAKMYKDISKERIAEIVKFVGLEKSIHNKVKTYSLGMRQRLGIAQALLHRPRVLILDEPTNGLDPSGIHELREYIRNLAEKSGTTVIVSSHILSEMELMCDRVAIINNGILVNISDIKTEAYKEDVIEVIFEVDKHEQIKVNKAILDMGENYVVDKNQIIFKTTKDKIPQINGKFVHAGIDVFQINIKTKNLEKTFMDITGGQKNDPDN